MWPAVEKREEKEATEVVGIDAVQRKKKKNNRRCNKNVQSIKTILAKEGLKHEFERCSGGREYRGVHRGKKGKRGKNRGRGRAAMGMAPPAHTQTQWPHIHPKTSSGA